LVVSGVGVVTCVFEEHRNNSNCFKNIDVGHNEVGVLKSGVVEHERLVDEVPFTLERVAFAFNVVSPGGALGKRMAVFIKRNKGGIGVSQSLKLVQGSLE